jgi:hypothetical protein
MENMKPRNIKKEQFAQRRMVNGCTASSSIAGWKGGNTRVQPTTSQLRAIDVGHKKYINGGRKEKSLTRKEFRGQVGGRGQELIIKKHHIIPMYIAGRRATQSARMLLHVLVEQQRLTNVLDLGDCALEVKCLGQNDFENLLQVSIGSDGEFNKTNKPSAR